MKRLTNFHYGEDTTQYTLAGARCVTVTGLALHLVRTELMLRQTLPRKIAALPAVDECCHTPDMIALEDLPGSQLATDEKYVAHFRFEYNLWPSFAFGDEGNP
jgi:hypothetical protein